MEVTFSGSTGIEEGHDQSFFCSRIVSFAYKFMSRNPHHHIKMKVEERREIRVKGFCTKEFLNINHSEWLLSQSKRER